MAYLEGHGYSGDGDFESDHGERDDDFSAIAGFAILCSTLVILLSSVLLSTDDDRTPWTSGSAVLVVGLAAVASAAALTYRSIRRRGGTTTDAGVGIATVLLATPVATAGGYVVLAILGIT